MEENSSIPLNNNLIQGMDNVSLVIVIMIVTYITYVIYKVIEEILNQRNNLMRGIDNINNLSEQHHLQEQDCPICHDSVSNAVELDCDHKYCAKCIMDYYKTTEPTLSCPMCRKNIRLINILNYDRDPETKKYIEMIVIFNHHHLNGYNYYLNYFLNFPFLFSHGVRHILSCPTQILIYSCFGIFTIAYFLSPIDLIPDTLGIIGYLDDFITILGFIYGVIRSFYSIFNELNEVQFNQIHAR